MSDRLNQLQQWLAGLGYADNGIEPASEDASFRSYWRINSGDGSLIVMDAPPDKEPCDSFIDVALRLRQAGLNAPRILEKNLQQGFLLLTDFGNQSYLAALNKDSENVLYSDALNALLKMQTGIVTDGLPPYDEALLRREMGLFEEWFLRKWLRIDLNASGHSLWEATQVALIENALTQPQVFVHRDYHSRNLMKLNQDNPGIIDFQDAVNGPVTYDLVSLLRDCYIDWPIDLVERKVLQYHRSLCDAGIVDVSIETFLNWFDLMGVQRHLKAIGIFSRLNIRDQKPGYLNDIPRTLEYVFQVSSTNPVLGPLSRLLGELDLESAVRRRLDG
ncbi:MAG: phosphotransferase [Pseudomonadota bacterium]